MPSSVNCGSVGSLTTSHAVTRNWVSWKLASTQTMAELHDHRGGGGGGGGGCIGKIQKQFNRYKNTTAIMATTPPPIQQQQLKCTAHKPEEKDPTGIGVGWRNPFQFCKPIPPMKTNPLLK